jgi:hypothetical protein
MTIVRVVCGQCQAALQVRAEVAAKQGRCPQCGAIVAIPKASDESAETLPLGNALTPNILAELSRKNKSAVLVVFDKPPNGSYALSKQPAAAVHCFRTGDMSQQQLVQVLGELAHLAPGACNAQGALTLAPPQAREAYDFKGDQLGISLKEFKSRHGRTLGAMRLPYTSEATPGQANATLASETWHAAAGIVHARIELPSENNSPTVAGVKTELLIYQFVDEQLYRITGLFDTEAYSVVRSTFSSKYGPPTEEHNTPPEVVWQNNVSSIRLVRGAVRPKKPSMIVYTHDELQRIVELRKPQRTSDL